jgi:hypothetical protein
MYGEHPRNVQTLNCVPRISPMDTPPLTLEYLADIPSSTSATVSSIGSSLLPSMACGD